MFKMKPEPVPMIGSIVVFILGLLFWLEGHRDPGNLPAHSRANLIFAISIIISGLFLIVATGRMWFKHLWHDRYGKQKKRRR
ncbi:hypothetical protein [Pontiella agarivorans]|nr:hypothetical protein [Pontiella agarivorans]